MEENKISIGKQ